MKVEVARPEGRASARTEGNVISYAKLSQGPKAGHPRGRARDYANQMIGRKARRPGIRADA